jgi:predicted AAA+ superfamily ATPase
MIFRRHIHSTLLARAAALPVVTVTGPRQSGKTTLCRITFPEKTYVNLERPDNREFARADPKAFLAQLGQGAVLDEIQRVPELLSWIQADVDDRPTAGRFILTGSHQFDLGRHVSQSLAGRTALLKLLPLSIAEILDASKGGNIDALIQTGGYPRIHADDLDPATALGDYFETYVQRDLRELVAIRHLTQFEKFVRLAAGRIGQLLNMQSLASDVGVSGHTVREWIDLLELSYVIFRLPPWFANIGKRLIKSPKLYFYDTGMAAWLMGITKRSHLPSHPLRGALFENLAVLEVLKTFHNSGVRPNLHFYRDSAGNEADLLLEEGNQIELVEIKSAQTIASDAMRSVMNIRQALGDRAHSCTLIYGGDERQQRSHFNAWPVGSIHAWLRKST